MFFLDYQSHGKTAAVVLQARPPLYNPLFFQSVRIYIYTHTCIILGNEEVLYLLAKAYSITQLQLTYIGGKIYLCTYLLPRLCKTRSHTQHSFASKSKFVTVDSVCFQHVTAISAKQF